MKCLLFFFITEFEIAAKVRKNAVYRSLISSSSRVITAKRRAVSNKKVVKNSVEINQN